jgi:hypothetical protein
VKFDLKPEVEAELLAQARAKGVSLDTYLRELLHQLAGSPAGDPPGGQDWEKALDRWVESSPEVPHLSDEALRREAMYRRG